MTSRTQSRVARQLARLRRYWTALEDAQPEIRNPRVPYAAHQRYSSSAIPSKVAHVDLHKAA